MPEMMRGLHTPLALAVAATTALIGAAAPATTAAPPTTPALKTLPGLRVPVATVTRRGVRTAPGYIFVAEKEAAKTGGPLILDNRGRVIWYHQLAPPVQATDFRVQRYHGRPVLTWWVGTLSKAGVGRGSYVDVRRPLPPRRSRAREPRACR